MDPISTLVALGGALGTSFLLSRVKGLDYAVTNGRLFRKLQPLVTLGGAVAAPWIVSRTGYALDPAALGAAPLATVLAITAAEVLSLTKKKAVGPPAPVGPRR
jgi:hypothetical protein